MAQSSDRVDLGVLGGGTVRSVFGRPETRQATVFADESAVTDNVQASVAPPAGDAQGTAR